MKMTLLARMNARMVQQWCCHPSWIVTALVATTSLAAIVLTPTAAAATAECSWVSGGGTHVTEGDGGTVTATIQLACTNATASTFSVHFATSDGTAVSPGDYVATSGDIPVPPGASNPAIAQRRPTK